ncbi:MAG: hypothetical protein CMI02_09630 [Oceanospirillaceae bacterium]|nr:hypothetical protein [Oceanospirillaceae bacterium]
MAQIYIHPTQRTPAQIEALQSATGRVAVFTRTGPALLIQRPRTARAMAPRRAYEHRLDASRYLRGPMRAQPQRPAPGFDPDFPPGAA